MRKISWSLFPVTVLALVLSGNATAALAYDQSVSSDIIFGSGNGDGFFTVDQENGIELALRGKLRGQGVYNSNGDGTYSFAVGATPIWNFEWSINSNYLETAGGYNLDDLTYLLQIDTNASQGVSYVGFDPIHAANPNFLPASVVLWDHGIGTNSTANGAGDNDTGRTAATYASLIAANNVAQNSWQSQWYDPSFSRLIDGTYNFQLTAYLGETQLARTNMQVIVGAGGAPVPEPVSMVMLGCIGAGMAAAKKLRRKNKV